MVEFRNPTLTEIDLIIKLTKQKMKTLGINSVKELNDILKVNYCNLTRVLKGTTIDMTIVRKLNQWNNE